MPKAWTAEALFAEAIAFGTGEKSVINTYSGWSSDEQTREGRDASIATTDAMTAMGYYYAGMAQLAIVGRQTESLEMANQVITAAERSLMALPAELRSEFRTQLIRRLRDVGH